MSMCVIQNGIECWDDYGCFMLIVESQINSLFCCHY
ncbi:hypothetical protein EPYR_01189 [Erwinia pyrifoliae DSM 12163]|nr:hypothetical protein EPYR_01189 [Erwinia pyrifoliae DSM 12163]